MCSFFNQPNNNQSNVSETDDQNIKKICDVLEKIVKRVEKLLDSLYATQGTKMSSEYRLKQNITDLVRVSREITAIEKTNKTLNEKIAAVQLEIVQAAERFLQFQEEEQRLITKLKQTRFALSRIPIPQPITRPITRPIMRRSLSLSPIQSEIEEEDMDLD